VTCASGDARTPLSAAAAGARPASPWRWAAGTCIDPVDPATLVCSSHFEDRFGRRLPELDAFRWVPFDAVKQLCAPAWPAS
jgi:hypothetical protein